VLVRSGSKERGGSRRRSVDLLVVLVRVLVVVVVDGWRTDKFQAITVAIEMPKAGDTETHTQPNTRVARDFRCDGTVD